MKVVVAIDSFKGSMTSMQAGNACKEGILAAACAHCGGGAAAVLRSGDSPPAWHPRQQRCFRKGPPRQRPAGAQDFARQAGAWGEVGLQPVCAGGARRYRRS